MGNKTVCPVKPETVTDEKIKLAPRYNVFCHNDDKTTFEFVIFMLMQVFHKPQTEAVRLTLEIHETGVAMVQGGLSYEQAEIQDRPSYIFS